MQVVDCIQGTESWFEARLGIPTASEFKRIVTPAKWQYASGAKSYIYELIDQLHFPGKYIGGGYSNLDMDRGTYLEPEARRYFEFDFDCEVRTVGFCKTDDGRLGCSPDGLIGEDSGLEIKSPDSKTQWAVLDAGVIPPDHLAQIHGNMIVTGRKSWNYISYCPGCPPLVDKVEWNEKTEFLKAALDKFWDDYQATLAKIKNMQIPLPTREVDYGELGTIEESVHEPLYF